LGTNAIFVPAFFQGCIDSQIDVKAFEVVCLDFSSNHFFLYFNTADNCCTHKT